MRDQSERGFRLADFLFDLGRDAVADVRAKLIDEGWFGRRTPDANRAAHDLGWGQGASPTLDDFEKQWAVREPGDGERTAPVPDHGMDR